MSEEIRVVGKPSDERPRADPNQKWVGVTQPDGNVVIVPLSQAKAAAKKAAK